eukprot:1160352-Pelagomonas_calceolata.AAC.2
MDPPPPLTHAQRGVALNEVALTHFTFTQDESRFMRLVSERIASTVGKAVIESELKIVLGFTGKKGHRYWRRIKVHTRTHVHKNVELFIPPYICI